LHQHQIIESLILRDTDNVVAAAINRWELIATQVVSIVGDGGFSALYVRSLPLAQATFSWLPAHLLSPQTDARFALLKASLEEQTPELAGAANHLLLITFTDILASLIGEDLTIRILHSVWSNDAPSQPVAEMSKR